MVEPTDFKEKKFSAEFDKPHDSQFNPDANNSNADADSSIF